MTAKTQAAIDKAAAECATRALNAWTQTGAKQACAEVITKLVEHIETELSPKPTEGNPQ